ncbi:hypothetical protein [Actinokineospora pegani]|uniref:hypothetical protein n=1 Tax=Actinokineospora pegani TaxID=2654637 RepID=UPI0012EAE13D|nr:hypothetical protein [Actinokineospora pegani]
MNPPLPHAAFAAFDATRQRRLKVFGVAALAFVACLGAFVWMLVDQRAYDGRKQLTTATVTGRQGAKGGTVFDLALQVDGRRYETSVKGLDGRTGDVAQVEYDPQDPTVVTALDASLHGVLPIYTGIGALLTGFVTLAGVVGHRHTRSIKDKPWSHGTAAVVGDRVLRVDLPDGPVRLRTGQPLPDGFASGEVAVQRLWGRKWGYVLGADPEHLSVAVELPA